MDSSALLQVIFKQPALKYRYMGCFDTNTYILPMLKEPCQIVNTTTDLDGHWITSIILWTLDLFDSTPKVTNVVELYHLFCNLF